MHMEYTTCLREGQLLTDEIIGYVWLILILCRRYYRNKALRASGSPKLQLGETFLCDRGKFGRVLSWLVIIQYL